MIKQVLRSKFTKIRNNLDNSYMQQSADTVCQSLLRLITNFNKYESISLYYPIKNEINILPIIKNLNGYKIALPFIKNKILVFKKWDGKKFLSKGKFCPQPLINAIEIIPAVIILPLLSFDRCGNRLGYGKGYYDRTLSNIKYKNVLKIGVAYSMQEYDNIPTEQHDIPLDVVISEKETIYIK